MDRDDRLNDNLPADGPAGPGPFDDAVGAYLLDALGEAELAEFEVYLGENQPARREVAGLRAVVALLPLALDDGNLPQPSANLRSKILSAAREDGGSSSPGSAASGATQIVPPQRPSTIPRPLDRGSTASGGTILPFVRRIGFERLVAGLLALVAAGAIVWGVSLQSRLNDTENDLDTARDELAQAEGNDEGVVRTVAYLLNPTPDGPETANAIVELQAENSTTAKITALGMPPTAEGRAYQLWFLDLTDAGEIEGAPRPSVTFQVGPDGKVDLNDVPVDGPFEAVAITEEPAEGSAAPTTAPIMFGTRGVAAG